MVIDMLQKALDFLREHNEIAFATCKGDFPKVRIFQIMKQEGTVLYFATSAQKAVWKELQENPNVELLSYADQISVRCAGTVNMNVPDNIRQWIYDHNDVLSRLYSNYDKLTYFSLNIADLDYYDLRPTPPLFKHFDLMTGEMGDGFVGERFSKK